MQMNEKEIVEMGWSKQYARHKWMNESNLKIRLIAFFYLFINFFFNFFFFLIIFFFFMNIENYPGRRSNQMPITKKNRRQTLEFYYGFDQMNKI